VRVGSMTILVGAVALVTALICLLVGYRWGRSNLRSQIEDAIKKERISLDAREFTMREQLDDQMAELVELRARAEEFSRQQEPLQQLKRQQMKEAESIGDSGEKLQVQTVKASPPVESTDVTIQKLLKSIEDNLRQPVAEPPKPNVVESQKLEPITRPESQKPEQIAKAKPEPQVIKKPAPIAKPEIKKPAPIAKPEIKKQAPISKAESKTTEPVKSAAVPPGSIVEDEWQEFASSLAALTRRNQ
jgi:hypothetical protein